jgi:hypothetical protein
LTTRRVAPAQNLVLRFVVGFGILVKGVGRARQPRQRRRSLVFDEKASLSLVHLDGGIALDHHGDRRQHEDGDGDVTVPVNDREAVQNMDVAVDREMRRQRASRIDPPAGPAGVA